MKQKVLNEIKQQIVKEINLNNIGKLWNKSKVKNNMNKCIQKCIDLFVKSLKDLSQYDQQVKHWREASDQATPNAVYDILKNNKEWKIDDSLIHRIYEMICEEISKLINAKIEPVLVQLFKPSDKMLNAMDPTNILNQII